MHQYRQLLRFWCLFSLRVNDLLHNYRSSWVIIVTCTSKGSLHRWHFASLLWYLQHIVTLLTHLNNRLDLQSIHLSYHHQIIVRIAWRASKLLLFLLDQLLFSCHLLFQVRLMLWMKLIFLRFFIWFNNIYGFDCFKIFDNFGGKFGFLSAFLRLRGGRSKFLFSDLFDLFSTVESLLEIFLSLRFEVLVMFDLILSFGGIGGESVFDFVLRILIFLCNLHWIRNLVESS